MADTTIFAWFTILAIVLGPIIAVRLTRYLDERKEKRERKFNIFRTLMATRSQNLSWSHVEALNLIEVEFGSTKKTEKAVIDAWKEYHDLLNRPANSDRWGDTRIALLSELLFAMARYFDYSFNKTDIKNFSYSPQAYADIDNEQTQLRQKMLEVLDNKRKIPMSVTVENPGRIEN